MGNLVSVLGCPTNLNTSKKVPAVLAVSADRGCLNIFSFPCCLFSSSFFLGEAR